MKLIIAISLLFGASVMAQGRWRNNDWNDNDWDNNDWNDNNNGYRARCTCVTNGDVNQDLGQRACNSLGDIWPNLQFHWFSGTCMDQNGVGLEPNGWEAACQRVAQQGGPWNDNNNNPFNPQAVRGTCF